tara:strand:- start:623 stop:1387 length:765 start_codon:yes stop_codon:yes gene_type:complete
MNTEKKFNKKKFRILRMKDKTDKSVIKKSKIFDVPMRLGIVGGTGSGKTNIIGMLLADPLKQFYRDVWAGEDIYIFSGSAKTDNKMHSIIKALDIPSSNIFNDYDDDVVNIIYEEIEDRIADIKGNKKNPHHLFIFDDLSFSHSIRSKRNNALGRLFLNGRKNNCSVWYIAQKYNQILPAVRVNLSGLILFNVPTSELEMVEKDHNFLANRKEFYKMFRDNVKEKHDFLVVNYSNNFDEMYLDKNFIEIPHTKK